VTHKKLAVRLYLERKTYSEIKKRIHHSHRAIQRYVEDFIAVAMMTTAGQSLFEISFLRRISPTLVREYQALYDTYNVDPYRERLAEVIAQFQSSASPSDAEKGGAKK
jgi:hypothetical protein